MLDQSDLDLRTGIQEELDFDEQHRRKHEEAHTKLVDEYVKYQNDALQKKNKFKLAFVGVCLFVIISPVIFLLVVSASILFGQISLESYNVAGTIAGDLIALIAAIGFLPKIIAKYCFDKKEDENIRTLLLNVYEHDKGLQKKETDAN